MSTINYIFADYDSFLVYSLVDRIDSVHLTGDVNLNAPFPSIHSKELMRNCIGLTYDFQTSTIFYSDIQKGSINAVHFNGSNHRIIVESEFIFVLFYNSALCASRYY